MKHKRLFVTISVSVVLLLVIIAAASFYLIDYALVSPARERNSDLAQIKERFPELRTWLDSLQAAKALRDTFIVMPTTGERAHALFVRSPQAEGRTAVLVHGYTDNATRMLPIARIYNREMRANVLLPDLHAHGQSEGDAIQMGWLDRLDVLRWISLAPKLFNTAPDSLRLLVHGVSMGAATTMCVSGEQTPSFVKCFVEDCGYTSVWDEFAQELSVRFSLPKFPLLYTASWIVKARYGWSFCEASPLKQVVKCSKPMFFIHGDKDTFVPTWMVRPLYEAKPQPKALWIAPGSKHADAYADHKEEYTRRVVAFAEKYL